MIQEVTDGKNKKIKEINFTEPTKEELCKEWMK